VLSCTAAVLLFIVKVRPTLHFELIFIDGVR
jgi:hypothetical protein